METTELVGIIFGTSGLWTLAQTLLIRHLNRKERLKGNDAIIKKTLESNAYYNLSEFVEKLLDKDFATPEERRLLEVLYGAYKANGWNGDMDSRIEKVHRLATKDLNK